LISAFLIYFSLEASFWGGFHTIRRSAVAATQRRTILLSRTVLEQMKEEMPSARPRGIIWATTHPETTAIERRRRRRTAEE